MVPMHATQNWPEALRAVRVIQSNGGLQKVNTPAGQFWITEGDAGALAEELQEQDTDEYGDHARGVHPGDLVLDCGANVGVFTRRALRAGASRVVAIEPAPWALECLRRNLADDIRQGRVVVYPKGVWDREDKLELAVPSGGATSAGTLVLNPGRRGAGLDAVVPLTTIDHLVAELQLSRVDFIKMDIEGAEPNALRGALQTVARFRPRLAISLEHRTSDPDTIPALTRRLWPEYRVECGKCRNPGGHLQPTVMFARPG